MPSGRRSRSPLLTLIKDQHRSGAAERHSARELDWSILMARAQGGDRIAYRRLLEEITPYLRAVAARRLSDLSDAEDAVQDVLLTLHAIRHTYDPTRPFGPWLVAIANRRLIDRLRRRGRSQLREMALMAEHETFPADQTNLYERAGKHRDLREAVDQLPAGQRQAIRLLKLEERSLKEAAAMSGMTIASLKVATHRALKSLRKMLVKGDAER